MDTPLLIVLLPQISFFCAGLLLIMIYAARA